MTKDRSNANDKKELIAMSIGASQPSGTHFLPHNAEKTVTSYRLLDLHNTPDTIAMEAVTSMAPNLL